VQQGFPLILKTCRGRIQQKSGKSVVSSHFTEPPARLPLGFRPKNKKWQTRIAPLQLSTLACFRTWGGSTGAGRTDLPLQSYQLFG
jgi:hypothetical protein